MCLIVFTAIVVVVCLALHTVMNSIRFICWFSARFWDIHDYLDNCGGDGTPSHMYDYTCWNCGKRFNI